VTPAALCDTDGTAWCVPRTLETSRPKQHQCEQLTRKVALGRKPDVPTAVENARPADFSH